MRMIKTTMITNKRMKGNIEVEVKEEGVVHWSWYLAKDNNST